MELVLVLVLVLAIAGAAVRVGEPDRDVDGDAEAAALVVVGDVSMVVKSKVRSVAVPPGGGDTRPEDDVRDFEEVVLVCCLRMVEATVAVRR